MDEPVEAATAAPGEKRDTCRHVNWFDGPDGVRRCIDCGAVRRTVCPTCGQVRP